MALQHDAQGFLVGDSVDLARDKTLAAIRDDVRAIRAGVAGIESLLARTDAAPRVALPGESSAGMEEADPAIKAFREVAQPMATAAPTAPAATPAQPYRSPLAPLPRVAQDAPARRAAQVPALLRPPVTPRTGGAGGNATTRSPTSAAAATQVVSELRATRAATARAPAKPPSRDSRGRFVRAEGAPNGRNGRNDPRPSSPRRTPPGAGAGSDDDEREGGAMRSLAERLVGAVKESSAGMEEADPAIKAFREVAQPMARGYELLTGGDKQKRQEGWLRRIYGSLTGFRKDESTFNKVAAKRLKSIDEKPAPEGGEGGSGLLGMLAGLLKRIPGVGALTAGAGTLLARGGGLLAGAGRAAAGAGRGLLGLGRGALRRLPLIGALLGGVGAASDIYDTETDDTLTRREKDKRDGSAVGGFAGGMGGMLVGAKLGALAGAFAGPIGAAIGGAVGGAAGMFFGDQAGKIIGDTVGGWVSDLREADIPGKIASAWDATTSSIKDAWDSTTEALKKTWGSALDKLSEGWKSLKDAAGDVEQWIGDKAQGVNDYIKDKTGVDIKAGVQAGAHRISSIVDDTTAAAKDTASGAGAKAAELGGRAVDAIKDSTVGRGAQRVWEGAKSIGGKIGDRWNDAKQYLLGASDKAGVDAGTVAKIANFESGFNADATPTRKDGTRISSAHGYGQFLDGTWTDMLNKYGAKYGVEGAGNLTKAQAKQYRGDKTLQAGMLAEFTKENIEKGRKYGGADDDANVYAFHNLGDRDAKNLLTGMQQNPAMTVREALLQGATTDKQRARVEAVISGNKSLYGDGNVTTADAYARMGQMMRRGDAFAADARQSQGQGKFADIAMAGGPEQPGGPNAAPAPMAVAQQPGSAPARGAEPIQPALPPQPSIAQAVPPAVPAGIATPAMPVVASARMPAAPTGPAVPAVAEAPRLDVPLASNSERKPVVVASPSSDVGQDLRERGIAHIVTGGLGA